MSRREQMNITIPAEGKVACVRGYRAADRLREAGRRPVFNGINGWTINLSGLGDVLAYCEHRGIAVVLDDQREDVVAGRQGLHVDHPDIEPGLWPDGGGDAA